MDESLPDNTKRLLEDLKQGPLAYDKRKAAEELEKLPDSNEDVVRALVVAETSDPHIGVREAAAQALLGAAHVAIIQSSRDLAEWKRVTEQTARRRIADEAIKASRSWFERCWYLLLFPVFLCSAGVQLTTTLPPIIVGMVFSFIIVRIAANFDRAWKKGLFTVLTPILILVTAALSARIRYYDWPFEWSDLVHPYLTMEQRFWRPVIYGVGGLIAMLLTVGTIWFFKSFARDKRTRGSRELEVLSMSGNVSEQPRSDIAGNWTCPKCGRENLSDLRFCWSCESAESSSVSQIEDNSVLTAGAIAQIQREKPIENDDLATIHIRRGSQFTGAALSFKVFINDVEAGHIKRKGQEMSFPVRPGRKSIQIKTPLRNSNILTVDVSTNETITLDCGIDSTGFYLRDPSSRWSSSQVTAEQDTAENYNTWMLKRWYIVLICIIAGSFLIGGLFPEGIMVYGLPLRAGIGVAVGFLLSYLIYKTRISQ